MIESFSEGNTLIIKLCPIWSTKDDSIIVHSRRPSRIAGKENHPAAIYRPGSDFLPRKQGRG